MRPIQARDDSAYEQINDSGSITSSNEATMWSLRDVRYLIMLNIFRGPSTQSRETSFAVVRKKRSVFRELIELSHILLKH